MSKNKFALTLVTSFTMLATTHAIAEGSNDVNNNWSGLYVGSSFGAGKGSADTSFTDNSFLKRTEESVGTITQETTTNHGSGDLSGDITGAIADLFVGYNFHLLSHPSFVLGGQLEGTFFNNIYLETSGQRDTLQVVTEEDGVTKSTSTTKASTIYELDDELTAMFTFLARAGYLIKPNMLLYVLGGGVEGNFIIPEEDNLLGDQKNKWVLGYTVGAGLEYKINDNWSLRGEYRYINFNVNRNVSTSSTESGDPDGPSNNTTMVTANSFDSDTDFNFNMGKFAVVYRFDAPSEHKV